MAESESGWTAWIAGVLRTTAGKIGAVFAASALAMVTAIITPVQDMVKDHFWPESLEVPLRLDVVEGEPQAFTIPLQDTSRGAGISGGVVNVIAASDELRLTGPTAIAFASAPGSIEVRPAPPQELKVIAQAPGTYRLEVKVTTNRGRSFDRFVTVRARPRVAVTSAKNMTGDYNIILNDVEGVMKIGETVAGERKFSGDSTFENGEAYKLSGWRDGTVFFIKFIRGGTPVYSAEGIYCIKKYDDAKWIVVNARVKQYNVGPATPQALVSKPRHTIRDRCPGYPSDLAELEGEGLLYASVEAN